MSDGARRLRHHVHERSTLKFFRLRRADYLLKNTSVSCTFWEPDPASSPQLLTPYSSVAHCLKCGRLKLPPVPIRYGVWYGCARPHGRAGRGTTQGGPGRNTQIIVRTLRAAITRPRAAPGAAGIGGGGDLRGDVTSEMEIEVPERTRVGQSTRLHLLRSDSRAPGPRSAACSVHRSTAQRTLPLSDPSQSRSSVSRPTAQPTAHRASPTPLYYLRC